MYFLYLETSSKNCSVAISKNKKLISLCEESNSAFRHNEFLHQFIKYALEGAEILVNELNIICINKGPGSYTGLRISSSAAKGLCYALNIPLISINSLEILIQSALNSEYEYIIPMIYSKNMNVYSAIFNRKGKIIFSTKLINIDKNILINFRKKKILIIGNASLDIKKFILNNSLDFSFIKFLYKEISSAKDMIDIGYRLFLNKQFESLVNFEPLYLKKFI